MKLKVNKIRFSAGRPVCIIHKDIAKKMSLHVGERISITKGPKKIDSLIDISSEMVRKKEIAVSEEVLRDLNIKKGSLIEIKFAAIPKSRMFIKKKLNGERLTKKEIETIIKDISRNVLTDVEIAFFISGVHSFGMSLKETKYMTEAMAKTGNILNLKGKIVDKHCIGGVAGNRTSPIVVSICAASGLIMPKTSSRAITSAAGTADTIETLTKVEFSIPEIKKIIKKTNACLIWGGTLGLAPSDSKIIKIERTLNMDSESQMLASILSKKLSVGSKYLLIDIPFGKSAKVTKRQAEKLKRKFLQLGKNFSLKMKVILTDGKEPIGNGIGPVLEMIDILKVLENKNPPKDLKEKSLKLAGEILDLSGKTKKGKGIILARKILESGKAFEKFKEIVEAQKGKIKKLKPGKFYYDVLSEKEGIIKHIDNKILNKFARSTGCPEDKSAGIYLYKKAGDKIKKKEKLMRVYAKSKDKLRNSKEYYKENKKNLIEFKI